MPVTIHRQWPLVATTIGGQAGIHSICSYDECEFRGRESLPAPRLGTLCSSLEHPRGADRCNVTLPDINGDDDDGGGRREVADVRINCRARRIRDRGEGLEQGRTTTTV